MMKSGTSILFIQLPLLNHSYDYIQGNIEYAPASLSGYIKKEIKKTTEIFTLPFVLSNYASDAIITDYVKNLQPDIIAFTCYAWNIERSLYIARMIKEQSENITIIFGGPEIQKGSIALAEYNGQVDLFVIGEGEWFFDLYFNGGMLEKYLHREHNNKILIQPQNELISSGSIYEPYTGNRINTMPDGSMFFELTRGCPYRCSYCLYAKNASIIREIPFEKLLTAIMTKQLNRRLNELYILSPALEVTKGFSEKLEMLAEMNHGIRLHSEMRAERVSPKLARLLYRAGFRSLEIGLQTLNSASLKDVGRNSDPEKELMGIQHLRNAGIDIKLGIIPGLPGDSPESFISMIDRLTAMGLQDILELYPLMILPGTEIRDRAIRDNVNFLRKPPYYYNYGWGMSFDDLKMITRYVEEQTGYSHITNRLPEFTNDDEGLYCRGILLDGNDAKKWNIQNYISYIQTSVFSFYITVDTDEAIYNYLCLLLEGLPVSELYNIIFYCNTIIDEKKILTILEKYERDHLLQRINIFQEWKNGLRIKLYQVIDAMSSYERARESYEYIVPIFRLSHKTIHEFDLLNDYNDNLLLSKGVFHKIKKKLGKFADSPESIAFEDTAEQKEFYSMIGQEYIQMPFNFKIMKS